MSRKTLLTSKEIEIILHRLACQLIENHGDFSNTVLIGLQPKGIYLAERIHQILTNNYNIKDLKVGILDITFYRDDFRRKNAPLEATPTKIDFLIENKKVVIIDDVLYSGRSVRAALTALQAYGRPTLIELLVLIDRRFSRHLPIQPNYRGRQVDAINDEKVVVHWKEKHEKDEIYIVPKQAKTDY
ncbi:bifunctional pyr operon transcriptional regulator/uracil phosphoribosyltransferase PyrR [Tenacibaculum sp. M341]|uniref:bifunctional pyr operon transcriptional regulator/uracil phosphoribosyltransferase PyrR n=1 Tax=Tenacibaculum sp. M341 TaxID=2530339 RepID=UPI001043D769|nr:bifunctional pyr operon transcriptional regulator/uracil phosphoribosyltransferase PyrR [Tenacibaculum sp. M341]TCI85262.1 bifunctional pyr operon transcriptional regulator/uracil phosphoribosyltransferase PyrR [Tenacibaculum sp. M341]